MRPCSNCRSVDTEMLDQGILTRLASTLGGEPELHAWVCRLCRHVDFWIDEVATDDEYRTLVAADRDDEPSMPIPVPIPAG